MKCYAACLGGCSVKQSREHHISKGLWKNEVLKVEGFPWLNGQSRSLPIKVLTAKLLCQKHNSDLSPYDAEAINFFNSLEQFEHNQYIRSDLKEDDFWKPDNIVVNGKRFERFLAKMAVGIFYSSSQREWNLDKSESNLPPLQIIRQIFGFSEFNPPMGLYLMLSKGDIFVNQDQIKIQNMFHPLTKGYIGAKVAFRSWQFFINLSNVDFSNYRIKSFSGTILGGQNEKPLYRPGEIISNSGNKISNTIKFVWN